MPTVTLQGGVRFLAEPDESILDAAMRADVNIGYACRNGRCSSCKCTVLEGETRALRAELGLEETESAAGQILSCVRTAVTDLTLVADELIPFALPPKQIVACRIDNLVRLAPDVLEVRLRLPPTANFAALPGQYIDVIGPGGIRRSYSLASQDGASSLCLHIREVPGGALSEYWFRRAQINDLLRLSGPLGTFFLRDVARRRLVFLATGTGIAPVTAMLEGLARPDSDRPIDTTVIWGGRHTADLYVDITRFVGPDRFWPVISRPYPAWSGRVGYVQDALLAGSFELSKTIVYACGSEAMIRSSRHRLIEAGLDPHDFYSDAFVCSATD